MDQETFFFLFVLSNWKENFNEMSLERVIRTGVLFCFVSGRRAGKEIHLGHGDFKKTV